MRLLLVGLTAISLPTVVGASRVGASRHAGLHRIQRSLKGSKGDGRGDQGITGAIDGAGITDGNKSKEQGKRKGSDAPKCIGTVVISNGKDGTLSIVEANLGGSMKTIEVPWDTSTMKAPVLVDVEAVNGVIYVSDSANDRVVAFNSASHEVIAIIPTGSSPTELTSDARGSQLWVANAMDNTIIVIDLAFNVPIRSIEAFDPEGVLDFGNNIVNDVLLSPSGDAGYATYTGDGGLLVRYNSNGNIEAYTTEIGNEARLSASFRFNCLYSPSTSSNALEILYNQDLTNEGFADIDSPYDAVSSVDGRYIYISSTTNNAIRTFDVANNVLLDDVVATSIQKPFKMAHTGDRLFVAHGESDQISVFSVSNSYPIPVEIANVNVGQNPIGIYYVAPTALCA